MDQNIWENEEENREEDIRDNENEENEEENREDEENNEEDNEEDEDDREDNEENREDNEDDNEDNNNEEDNDKKLFGTLKYVLIVNDIPSYIFNTEEDAANFNKKLAEKMLENFAKNSVVELIKKNQFFNVKIVKKCHSLYFFPTNIKIWSSYIEEVTYLNNEDFEPEIDLVVSEYEN